MRLLYTPAYNFKTCKIAKERVILPAMIHLFLQRISKLSHQEHSVIYSYIH